MAKKSCAVCEKELGLLSGKVKISDGVVCSKCLSSAGILALNNPLSYNQESIKNLVSVRQAFVNKFHVTKSVGTYIHVDETNKAFSIGGNIFSYDNLLSFELLEDGQSITKGGLGRAVAGAFLFGVGGAIVGGVTGGKKSKGICNSMKLRVSLKNAHIDVAYINFITTETKTKSFIYKAAQDNAQKCITVLEQINDANENSQIEYAGTIVQPLSAADEIVKFKALLDQGIITQEEFDFKKKELLGL